MRDAWGVADEEILVAFVGRLATEKGIDTLLEAMKLLAQRDKGPKLVLAGDGPKHPMIERFIAREAVGERIRLLGFMDDVRDVLSAADIFASPSRWEGFPLAVGEAMAAELPVVATRVPGLQDIIADGETGLLVEKNDAKEFADAIERLIADTDLRDRFGRAGRERMIEHFAIQPIIKSHEQLYLELAALSNAGGSK
ncbi:MAG: glycosyltransferase [Planctomycetota bacterium]